MVLEVLVETDEIWEVEVSPDVTLVKTDGQSV